MKLLLDIGNSRIKWATLTGTTPGDMHAVAHDKVADGHWQQALRHSMDSVMHTVPEEIRVSNVAGAAFAESVALLMAKRWPSPVRMVTTAATATVSGHTIRNAYRDHTKLGVDRWLALLAAFEPGKTALIVSVGTAMTLDAIDANGTHLGGLIVPGPTLMQSALLNHTSDIAAHAEQGAANEHFLADNTLGCIVQGSWRACAGLIHDTHARLLNTHAPVKVCITGGAAPALLPLLNLTPVQVPDLVLRGLSLLP